MEPTTLFTDDDLAAINRVRTILEDAKNLCRSVATDVPSWNGMAANAGDYARAGVYSEVAADALFDVLNATHSYGVQKMTDDVLHNRDAVQS